MQATSVSDLQRQIVPSKSQLSSGNVYFLDIFLFKAFESYLTLLLSMMNCVCVNGIRASLYLATINIFHDYLMSFYIGINIVLMYCLKDQVLNQK